MKSLFKYFFLILIFTLIIIQFFRPEKTKQSINQHHISYKIRVPDSINKILIMSCYDCHSNQTNYPWYSHIMPFGWMIAYDIKNGRNVLNFSEWGKYNLTKQNELLGKICGMTASGKMPHWKYLIIHKKAKLSDSEKLMLCKWSLDNCMLKTKK